VLGVYTTSLNISGTFELALPLPPNLPLTSVQGGLLSFSFSDGVATRTLADSVVCSFELATDLNGNIVQWDIYLRENGIAAGNPQHGILVIRGAASSIDEGAIVTAPANACDGALTNDQGILRNMPGTFMLFGTPVPSLPSPGLAALAVLMLIFAALALRRPGRASA
jgi:hypothetical protein